jgi:hypothetical protein
VQTAFARSVTCQAFSLLVGALGCISCTSDGPVIEADALPPIARLVVGEAANRLDDHGRFILDEPLDLPYPQITATQAVSLADAFQKVAIVGLLQALEDERGGGINPAAMQVCGRIFYAEPAVEALPAEVLPGVRRAFGPHWIVNYCGASGKPEVAFAVSAYATNLRIENGKLVYPTSGNGEYFRVIGIPKSRQDGISGEPEVAAAQVAALTGVRVSAVPHLVSIPGQIAPEVAIWRVEIERPANVRGKDTGVAQLSSTLYFTDDMRWGHRGPWTAQSAAPSRFEYRWPIFTGGSGDPPIWRTGSVNVRPGFALRIEPIAEILK